MGAICFSNKYKYIYIYWGCFLFTIISRYCTLHRKINIFYTTFLIPFYVPCHISLYLIKSSHYVPQSHQPPSLHHKKKIPNTSYRIACLFEFELNFVILLHFLLKNKINSRRMENKTTETNLTFKNQNQRDL